jgi:hypothetical protein
MAWPVPPAVLPDGLEDALLVLKYASPPHPLQSRGPIEITEIPVLLRYAISADGHGDLWRVVRDGPRTHPFQS